MMDQSKVNILPLRCNTFLLLSHLVTVYFCNDLVTDCLFRDKFKNIFIVQK
jgi:hypothetical protein